MLRQLPVFVLLLSIAGLVRAQDKTDLAWKFEKDKSFFQELTTKTTQAIKVQGLDVNQIPTNVNVARIDEDDEVYRTVEEKYRAIVIELAAAARKGQPVLVGTTSIEKSELLSRMISDVNYLTETSAGLKAKLAAIKEGKEREYREALGQAIADIDPFNGISNRNCYLFGIIPHAFHRNGFDGDHRMSGIKIGKGEQGKSK